MQWAAPSTDPLDDSTRIDGENKDSDGDKNTMVNRQLEYTENGSFHSNGGDISIIGKSNDEDKAIGIESDSNSDDSYSTRSDE